MYVKVYVYVQVATPSIPKYLVIMLLHNIMVHKCEYAYVELKDLLTYYIHKYTHSVLKL